MKKIKILSLIGITLFLLNACNKETEFEQNVSGNQMLKFAPVLDYSLDNIPTIAYNQDVENLLLNPDDRDDEKINNYLYQLSIATRDLIKDANFNRIIIEMALASPNQTANLLELEVEAPEYFNAINNRLSSKGLSLRALADGLTHAPVNPNPEFPETAEIERYYPAIFIPNLDNVDNAKQPIISPNIEVDCREDESIEDNIIAWYFTKNGDLHEILLSEKTSLLTSNPLFLLDNASSKVKKNEVAILPPEEESKTTTSFSSHEYSIENGYGYESWLGGKSEFCVQAYRIAPNGVVHWIYNSSGWKEIAKVKRNDIGDLLYKWSHHASNWQPWSNPWTPNVIQYGVNMVYWNTYERDWNRSPKELGTCTANGATIYLSGKRKYTSEWYAWIPSTAHTHYTRFQWVYYNWAHWNSSWKSKFRLWRVEI